MWWLQHHHHRAYAAGSEHALMLSGTTTSLRAFAQAAFAAADLDLADHLESVEALKRPADLAYSAMDPSRIAAQLGWAANRLVQEIVAKMVRAEL
jgi:GDPmannose 4,6-dehydratase